MEFGRVGISYSPNLREDDTLYSVLAQLRLLNSFLDRRDFLYACYGVSSIAPRLDLPNNLAALQSRLGRMSPYIGVAEIIEKSTLYPYYRPFISQAAHQAAVRKMNGNEKAGIKASLGLLAQRFAGTVSLRYCQDCVTEDEARGTGAYWHRHHLLPGVALCSNHGTRLIKIGEQNRYSNPYELREIPTGRAKHFEMRKIARCEARFCHISAELLCSGMQNIGGRRLAAAYLDRMVAMGLASASRRVRWKELRECLSMHHDNFDWSEHSERIRASKATPMAWLCSLIYRPDQSHHPVCHLLLIDCLFGSIAELTHWLDSPIAVSMPGPILAVTPIAVEPPLDQHVMLLDSSLSCIAVAGIIRKSVNTVIRMRKALNVAISSRPKYLTSALVSDISTMLLEGFSVRRVATAKAVSLSTVYRIRGYMTTAQKEERRFAYQKSVGARREWWLAAAQSTARPDAAATRERRKNYIWLYRHDRQWLLEHTFAATVPRSIKRQDWSVLDKNFAVQAISMVDIIKVGASRTRISQTMILRGLGFESMVTKNRLRFPVLLATISALVETIEDYQYERINRILLAAGGEYLQKWRIQRLAGIKTWTEKHMLYVENYYQSKRPSN